MLRRLSLGQCENILFRSRDRRAFEHDDGGPDLWRLQRNDASVVDGFSQQSTIERALPRGDLLIPPCAIASWHHLPKGPKGAAGQLLFRGCDTGITSSGFRRESIRAGGVIS